MSEPLHSFVVSVSCIVGVAILIPVLESLVRMIRRSSTNLDQPEVVQLTPVRPRRRGF
ncbi:hypothetical protein HDF16_001321 [Granulicella aggregans]|jgi:hypothetical protein|uniref:Uncharacterized protein n=1 Tax=Granulicella aggregans TaxID=474949 RepID=A0A7W7ZC31_9BACT|nr:hypothetical protein [Granulicella aggregans]MBB5056636.1 hypothetical protein [Granulicella aggregans]